MSPTLILLSNQIHVIVSLLVTSILLVAVIRTKDQVNQDLLSEKKKLEDALAKLQETQDRLIKSEKMASLGQMSAGINHEIKNPINFIQGSIEAMRRDMKEETYEKNRDYFKFIEDGLGRIKRIVNSLSHFSHQSQEPDQKCELHPLLDNCLNILEHKSKGRIEIVKNYCELKHIMGNSGQLHQVFLNLLSNAMQAIDKRGQISITTQQDARSVHVIIDDTGEGITPEVLEKIFDPFFTTKKPGEGTGLGLAISTKIINDHGGNIAATSEVGKGTTFRVYLPLK